MIKTFKNHQNCHIQYPTRIPLHLVSWKHNLQSVCLIFKLVGLILFKNPSTWFLFYHILSVHPTVLMYLLICYYLYYLYGFPDCRPLFFCFIFLDFFDFLDFLVFFLDFFWIFVFVFLDFLSLPCLLVFPELFCL